MPNHSKPHFFDEKAAASYDERNRNFAPIMQNLHFLMRLVLKDLPESAQILCVGVGTGADILGLASAFPGWRFTGIDPSAPMLEVCQRRLGENGLTDRCQLIHGELSDLPGENRFDAVLCLLVAHFIQDPAARQAFFDGMASRLKPGGYLVNAEISYDVNGPDFPVMLELKGRHIAERVGLYRGNLTATWDKVLAGAYPVLRRLVGEEFFSALARAYGLAHPSDSPDLNRFGATLAQFLDGFPHIAGLPYLPDMARLEWLLHRAYYAPDGVPIDPRCVEGLAADDFCNARFALHPACAVFSSNWAVVPIWLAHRDSDTPAFPQRLDLASHAVVTRPRFEVRLEEIDAAAAASLHVFDDGGTVGEAIDAAFALDPRCELEALVRLWLGSGALNQPR